MKSLMLVAAFAAAVSVGSAQQTVKVKTQSEQVRITINRPVIKVFVNGEEIIFSNQQPVIIGRRVFVPVRGVFEEMNIRVDWMAEENRVHAVKGEKTVDMWIGRTTADVEGRQVGLEAPPRLLRGRTLVPLRFIGESLGAQVIWNAENSTVTVTTNDPPPVR